MNDTDEPQTVELGCGIHAGCCDNPQCNYVHLRILDERADTAYHCMMSAETARGLIDMLKEAVKRKKPN